MIAADTGIPSLAAHSLLVSTATSRRCSRREGSRTRLGLSRIPVRDTPRSLSSLQFFCQIFLRYWKSVKVDWIVPRIVAIRTFSESVTYESVGRTTTSVRLQNWYGRRIISAHTVGIYKPTNCALDCRISNVFPVLTRFNLLDNMKMNSKQIGQLSSLFNR